MTQQLCSWLDILEERPCAHRAAGLVVTGKTSKPSSGHQEKGSVVKQPHRRTQYSGEMKGPGLHASQDEPRKQLRCTKCLTHSPSHTSSKACKHRWWSPTLKALEAAGLYTLKWLILCYVNFASIKFFKHEKDCILTFSIYVLCNYIYTCKYM